MILRYIGDGDPLDIETTVERSAAGVRIWFRGRAYRPESLSSAGFVIAEGTPDERELLREVNATIASVN